MNKKVISNFTSYLDTNMKLVKDPVDAMLIYHEMNKLTNNYPMIVGDRLYNHKIEPIDNPDKFMGWLLSIGINVHFLNGGSFIKWPHYFAFVKQICPKFDSISHYPKWPNNQKILYKKHLFPSKTGKLDELLDFFLPFHEVDRIFLKAMFATAFWANGNGIKPCFMLIGDPTDTNGGVGIGKSKLTEVLSTVMKTRIMDVKISTNDLSKMIVNSNDSKLIRFDNVRSENINLTELETLLTSKTLSADRKFGDTATINNDFMYVITMNQPSMPLDLATRTVVIRLKRPEYSHEWNRNIDEFLDKEGDSIVKDILFLISSKGTSCVIDSRYPEWIDEIVRKCMPNVTMYNAITAQLKNGAINAMEKSQDVKIVEDYIDKLVVDIFGHQKPHGILYIKRSFFLDNFHFNERRKYSAILMKLDRIKITRYMQHNSILMRFDDQKIINKAGF